MSDTALLALGGLVIHANPDGTVQLGAVALPSWMASDIAVRLAEASGEVPEAQASRRRVREQSVSLVAGAVGAQSGEIRRLSHHRRGV